MTGRHLRAIATRIYDARTVRAVFDPQLADLHEELEAAARQGRWAALRVLCAGHWNFARTIAALAWEDGRDRLRQIPWLLALPALITSSVGVSLLRGPAGMAQRQAIYLAVGCSLMLVAALAPRRGLVGGRAIFAGAGLALLALVAVRGLPHDGATRWLSIGGLQVLPGELVRPLLLLALAGELEVHGRRRSGAALARFVVVAALFIAAIVREPDPGVALVLLATVGAMAWAGASTRGFARLVSLLCAGGALAIAASARATVPDGSDAARHTDLVLGVVRERAGLAGVALLLAVALSTVWVARTAARGAPDAFSRSIVAGFVAATLTQTALHVGAAIGALPQLGLALPTLSYGGSSLVAHLASIGIVAGIVVDARRRPRDNGTVAQPHPGG